MMTVIFLLQLNWQYPATHSNKLVVSALDMREYVLHYRNSADCRCKHSQLDTKGRNVFPSGKNANLNKKKQILTVNVVCDDCCEMADSMLVSASILEAC